MQSIGIVGAAGSGKSTLAKRLVEHGYEKHALADPLKVQLGFMAHVQLGIAPNLSGLVVPMGAEGYGAIFDSIRNIMAGEMGINWRFDSPSSKRMPVTHRSQYGCDRIVRDYFVRWVDERKDFFRKALQYYGTETIRDLAGVIHPDEPVPWVRVLLSEARRDAALGHVTVCDDVRFPDEVDALRAAGFTIVRVIRPGQEQGAPAHASEEYWRTLPVDVELINDGTLEQFTLLVDEFLAQEKVAA